MNTTELAVKTEQILTELCGEQYEVVDDPDGPKRFFFCFGGIQVGLSVEPFLEDDSILVGHHVIGTDVQNMEGAVRFVALRNARNRVGRIDLCGDNVVFVHHMFSSSVDKESVRHLLGTAAGESCGYPELAELSGALRLGDLAALEENAD